MNTELIFLLVPQSFHLDFLTQNHVYFKKILSQWTAWQFEDLLICLFVFSICQAYSYLIISSLYCDNTVCRQMILAAALLQSVSLYIFLTAWCELLSLGFKTAALLLIISSLCSAAIIIADLRLALCCELKFLLRRNINETKLNSSAVCNWIWRQSALSF